MCSTTPLLWCYSAARLQSYVISYFCASLVYYIIQNVLVNKKIGFLFNINKAAFVLIYWFSSSFRMGDALPGPGRCPMGLQPAGQVWSPKRTFLQGLQLAGQGSNTKRTFSWCWLVFLCHVIKTTKMADKLEKTLTFQRETNILHHYKDILLLKLLWQNQNYQLVMGGSSDWSLAIWLHEINLTDSHPNLIVNSYDQNTFPN